MVHPEARDSVANRRFARGRQCDELGDAIRRIMQISSILLWSHFDVHVIVEGVYQRTLNV